MLPDNEKNQIIDLAKEIRLKHFTPNPSYLKVNIDEFPHIFFLGCLMDRQIPYEKAFNIPNIIAQEIGYNFSSFASKDKNFYVNYFNSNRLHRFNNQMAINFYEAVQKINNEYNGNAAKIWNDNPSSTTLLKRLKSFKGIGTSIANMIINILERRGFIKIDRIGIDISPDRNVLRVITNMGLINKPSQKEAINVARIISPEYPGLLDKLFWEIGRFYCLEDNRKCNICYIRKYCNIGKGMYN